MARSSGTLCDVHVTLFSLSSASGSAPGEPHTLVERSSAGDVERDLIDILKRLSRRPIDPVPQSELVADLGFDSLLVLELVGELEDHFNIAIPLNSLTHIRTVSQITDEVRRLVHAGASAS
jgi:acyl carrier protein